MRGKLDGTRHDHQYHINTAAGDLAGPGPAAFGDGGLAQPVVSGRGRSVAVSAGGRRVAVGAGRAVGALDNAGGGSFEDLGAAEGAEGFAGLCAGSVGMGAVSHRGAGGADRGAAGAVLAGVSAAADGGGAGAGRVAHRQGAAGLCADGGDLCAGGGDRVCPHRAVRRVWRGLGPGDPVGLGCAGRSARRGAVCRRDVGGGGICAAALGAGAARGQAEAGPAAKAGGPVWELGGRDAAGGGPVGGRADRADRPAVFPDGVRAGI